jgi:hypothetical protein
LNSSASDVNVRARLKRRCACRLKPSPARITVARSLYWMSPVPVSVVIEDGSELSSVNENGYVCCPAFSRCVFFDGFAACRNDQSWVRIGCVKEWLLRQLGHSAMPAPRQSAFLVAGCRDDASSIAPALGQTGDERTHFEPSVNCTLALAVR